MPAHHKLKGKEQQVVKLYNDGKKVVEIAKIVNVTPQAIYAFINRECVRQRPTIECVQE